MISSAVAFHMKGLGSAFQCSAQVVIAEVEQRMLARATAANPALLAIKGVGPVVGAQLLITAGDNPDRLRSSASFAALCGTAPIPVSSGRTDRHRLSTGGDRQANAITCTASSRSG